MMDLNKLAREAYDIAKAHGWHEEEYSKEHSLMLIITEIAESVQADRKEKHADVAKFKEWQGNSLPLSEETMERRFKEDFESYIKNTVEDELADIIIRCLDLAGLRNIRLTTPTRGTGKLAMTFPEYAFNTCHVLTYTHVPLAERLENVIGRILFYCESNSIEIEWFIEQKMKYNRTRSYKHGGLKY